MRLEPLETAAMARVIWTGRRCARWRDGDGTRAQDTTRASAGLSTRRMAGSWRRPSSAVGW